MAEERTHKLGGVRFRIHLPSRRCFSPRRDKTQRGVRLSVCLLRCVALFCCPVFVGLICVVLCCGLRTHILCCVVEGCVVFGWAASGCITLLCVKLWRDVL